MLYFCEAGHPDATDLTRDFSPGNSNAMDILTLGLGLEFRASGFPWPQEYRSEFSRVRASQTRIFGPCYKKLAIAFQVKGVFMILL